MNTPTEQRLIASLQNGYPVNIKTVIARGWQLTRQNLGMFACFTLICLLLNVASIIPGVGTILLFLQANLYAGYFWVAFKLLRSQPVTFTDFFLGFNDFVSLLLANLFSSVILSLVSLPAGIGLGFFGKIGWKLLVTNPRGSSPSVVIVTQALQLLGVPFISLAIALSVPLIYLGVSYSLSIPFVIDRKLPPWRAIETSRCLITRNWFGIFYLVVVLVLINLLGLIPFGLGLLVTIPLTFCSFAVIYQDIAGLAMASSLEDENPLPDGDFER
jgi:uncharacterized membrane protein